MADRERYTCTKDAPWTADKSAAEHPGAEYLGSCLDDCCDRYRCQNCGKRFKVTVPQ